MWKKNVFLKVVLLCRLLSLYRMLKTCSFLRENWKLSFHCTFGLPTRLFSKVFCLSLLLHSIIIHVYVTVSIPSSWKYVVWNYINQLYINITFSKFPAFHFQSFSRHVLVKPLWSSLSFWNLILFYLHMI